MAHNPWPTIPRWSMWSRNEMWFFVDQSLHDVCFCEYNSNCQQAALCETCFPISATYSVLCNYFRQCSSCGHYRGTIDGNVLTNPWFAAILRRRSGMSFHRHGRLSLTSREPKKRRWSLASVFPTCYLLFRSKKPLAGWIWSVRQGAWLDPWCSKRMGRLGGTWPEVGLGVHVAHDQQQSVYMCIMVFESKEKGLY